MPLRTVQPLSRPAIITNKNFFSHLPLFLSGEWLIAKPYLPKTFLTSPTFFWIVRLLSPQCAISHFRIAKTSDRLFIDRALGVLHAPCDFVLRARPPSKGIGARSSRGRATQKSPLVRREDCLQDRSPVRHHCYHTNSKIERAMSPKITFLQSRTGDRKNSHPVAPTTFEYLYPGVCHRFCELPSRWGHP